MPLFVTRDLSCKSALTAHWQNLEARFKFVAAALLCRVSAHVSATHVAFVPLNQAGKPS